LLVLALVGASLVSAATAKAAPTWLSSFPASPAGTDNGQVHVAMGLNGDSGAIWRETDSPNDHVVAAIRPAGGNFNSPQTLDTFGANPDVGMDANGNAVAAWIDGSTGHVQFSRAAAGAPFASGLDIPGQTTNAVEFSLGVAPDGEAVCAWRTGSGISVSFAPPGAGFGAPQDFAVGNPSDPQVAIAPTGETLLAFIDGAPDPHVVRAAVRPPGGTFGSPTVVSPTDESPEGVSVALNDSGNGIVAWPSLIESMPGPVFTGKPEAVFVTPGGFSSKHDIADATDSVSELATAIGPSGLVTALWTSTTSGNESLLAATAPVGGAFSSPAQTLSTTVLGGPGLASDPVGDIIASWHDTDGSFNRAAVAVAPAGQPFGASKFVSPAGQHSENGIRAAMDDQGDGIVGFPLRDTMTGNDATQIAGYDAAGPQLRGLSMPSGLVNRPIFFSVAPVDVWSQVTSTQWSFGDGQSSGSPTPMHLFSTPGTFSVSLTATDALGNATSASGSVTVTPAPPRKKPSISKARLSRRRFRAAHGRGVSIATAVGTTVRFTLSQVATMRFRVERCAKLRHGKCRRYKLMPGSQTKGGGQGPNSVRFTGRWRRKPLRPGLYRLDLQASTRGVRSATKRLAFQIVKR
jgi:PKD domain-containing protein